MENLESLWHEITKDQSLIDATLSNVRNKNETDYTQVRIKPVLIKEELHYHLEYVFKKKVTHENLQTVEFNLRMAELASVMKQINIYTARYDYQVLISKKMKVTIIEKAPSKKNDAVSLSHNRKKQYIFEEGTVVPFLVELGVMSREGMVVKSKYNKFRQINRFVELVKDVTSELPQGRKIRIIDFGCGKSYLTFALHYYLKELCGLDIEVVGLDLKQDVIDTCNNLTEKLGLENIKFLVGDIEKYTEYNEVDMVVTLHACNTATDAALVQAQPLLRLLDGRLR